ncbi:MAG TPA: hypothetical protein VGY98_08735 [Verrucomicrobiae bacterium]|jgi:hypothetical protein|nr:hypothetical protein [Verrucomicrobiae bacterium]
MVAGGVAGTIGAQRAAKVVRFLPQSILEQYFPEIVVTVKRAVIRASLSATDTNT